MYKLIMISAFLFSTNLYALDIKGLEVDKPVDCVFIKSLETRSGTFYPACEEGKERWFVEVSFLSGKTQLMIKQSPDKILESIYTSGFDFNEGLNSLTVKFGEPKIRKSVIQNRMGATFDQIEAIWVEGKTVLSLLKHSSTIGKASLMLTGEKAVSEFEKSIKEKAINGAKNI